MDSRLKTLDDLVQKNLKYRVAIIDMIYVVTTTGSFIPTDQIKSFLLQVAQAEKRTLPELFAIFNDEIEKLCRQGITTEQQFERLVDKLTI